MRRFRFAPSPTGPLHLGHAYSAGMNALLARECGGEVILRIEDTDQSRSRDEWKDRIFQDLEWLGLRYSCVIETQMTRMEQYRAALKTLWDQGLSYGCECKRADIRAALSAPQEGVDLPMGPDGLIYPGTCRTKGLEPLYGEISLRLNMKKTIEVLETVRISDQILHKEEIYDGHRLCNEIGDVVIARAQMGTSYHLSVVVDDHDQGITDVCRGEDLWPATIIHVLLQRLLGFSSPTYHHHKLIRDEAGKRLAKRHDAKAIATYRDAGASPADIWRMVGLAELA